MSMVVCNSFAFYVFIESPNCLKESYFGRSLLYIFKKTHAPNLKIFRYRIWTSVQRSEKLSSKTKFSLFSHTSYSNFRLKLFFKGFNCNVFLCFKTTGAIWKQKTVSRDKTVDKTFGQTLVFVWNSALRENLISIFQQLFTNNNKTFVLGERIATRLWFYEVLRFFWWFLIS